MGTYAIGETVTYGSSDPQRPGKVEVVIAATGHTYMGEPFLGVMWPSAFESAMESGKFDPENMTFMLASEVEAI